MHRHQLSCPLVFCPSSFLIHFKNGTEYLSRGITLMLIPLMRFLRQSLASKSFLVCLRYCFVIFSFISVCVMMSASNIPKYSLFPNIPKYFSKRSDSFLICHFYSFRYLSFSTFHYEHGTFSNAKFHSYILSVYSYCLYQSL